MIEITCKRCKKKVRIFMYLYDGKITDARALPTDPPEYRASIKGKAVCPLCGEEIHETFSSRISDKQILSFVIRESGVFFGERFD